MKSMRKILAIVLCLTMIAALFYSCSKDEKTVDNIQTKLIGTWTEKNTLFTDVLTLRENGEFSFQSHLSYCNGSGNYKYERTTKGAQYGGSNQEKTSYIDILILYFAGRGSETLKIVNVTNNILELTDQYDNEYHFKK